MQHSNAVSHDGPQVSIEMDGHHGFVAVLSTARHTEALADLTSSTVARYHVAISYLVSPSCIALLNGRKHPFFGVTVSRKYR